MHVIQVPYTRPSFITLTSSNHSVARFHNRTRGNIVLFILYNPLSTHKYKRTPPMHTTNFKQYLDTATSSQNILSAFYLVMKGIEIPTRHQKYNQEN